MYHLFYTLSHQFELYNNFIKNKVILLKIRVWYNGNVNVI